MKSGNDHVTIFNVMDSTNFTKISIILIVKLIPKNSLVLKLKFGLTSVRFKNLINPIAYQFQDHRFCIG
jgi:hypothetical protein